MMIVQKLTIVLNAIGKVNRGNKKMTEYNKSIGYDMGAEAQETIRTIYVPSGEDFLENIDRVMGNDLSEMMEFDIGYALRDQKPIGKIR